MKLLKDSLKELIDTLSDEQLENLNEYADYHFSKAEVDSEISLAKNKIYLFYKQELAPLINNIEVYSHHFDIGLYSGIETIFRCMASMEKNFTEEYTKEQALKCYDDLMDYAINLRSLLSIRLIKIYLKIIKQHKKKLTKFNYTGVYPNFKKEINSGIKDVKRKLKLEYKLYNIKFIEGKDINLDFKIDEDALNEQKLLQDALKRADSLIKLCEDNHSDIISSGYSNVFLDKILPPLSIVLSIIFSIVGVIGLIQLFQ